MNEEARSKVILLSSFRPIIDEHNNPKHNNPKRALCFIRSSYAYYFEYEFDVVA